MVVETYYAAERAVADAVALLGFQVYLPKYQVRESIRGRIIRKTLLLFPGYVLVRMSATWRALLSIRGVVDVLRSDESPSRVAHSVIRKIQALEVDGFVVMDDVPELRQRFKNGDKVRAGTGPMAGLYGTFLRSVGANRVRALMRMLGGEREVELPRGVLVPA